MTERDALLSAIRENWRDDMPRLAFADWLEEFGTSEWDRATCELIRMSKRRAIKSRIIDWLAKGERWKIFVPTLLKKTSQLTCTDSVMDYYNKGIFLRFKYTPINWTRLRHIRLFWERGFVRTYRSPSPQLKRFLEPILALDCPLVLIKTPNQGLLSS